jgi:hypothetical protein
MVQRPEEGTMEPSTARRLLLTTAVVSALAILVVSPANAYLPNEGGSAVTPAPVVGNPGDSAWIAQGAHASVANAGDGADALLTRAVTPSGSSAGLSGIDTGTAVGLGGALLVALVAGGLLLSVRHRRVALP